MTLAPINLQHVSRDGLARLLSLGASNKTMRRAERRIARNEAKRQADERRANQLIERYCARLELYERLYFYGNCKTEKYQRIREQVLNHIRRLDTHLFTA